MSSTFKGFSDRDIEKMKFEHVSADVDDNQVISAKETKFQHKRTTMRMNSSEKTEVVTVCPIPEDARLSSTKQNALDVDLSHEVANVIDGTNLNNDISNSYENSDNNNSKIENGNNSDLKYEMPLVENIEICEIKKPINLEEFQIKQKLMEEQNRRRRDMIAKALADRTKQTTEEAIRLEKIKKEFQTLDTRLSVDVCILRKQIDQASLAYAEAEKHYIKVESEFLTAKINLHKEREKKEQLTEHLCAIIAHNEARKAKKLEDLMEQLGSEPCKRSIVDGVCEQTGKMLELDENAPSSRRSSETMSTTRTLPTANWNNVVLSHLLGNYSMYPSPY